MLRIRPGANCSNDWHYAASLRSLPRAPPLWNSVRDQESSTGFSTCLSVLVYTERGRRTALQVGARSANVQRHSTYVPAYQSQHITQDYLNQLCNIIFSTHSNANLRQKEKKKHIASWTKIMRFKKSLYNSYSCLPFANQLFGLCILRLFSTKTMFRKFHLNQMHDHRSP